MNTRATLRRTATVLSATALALTAVTPSALAGGYPYDCDKQQVLVVEYDGSAVTPFTTIQEAVDFADGNDAGSSVGDTVIVCPGEYHENVHIPGTDDGGTPDDPGDDVALNTNLSVRSWNGPHEVTIVGDLSEADAVVDIDANGVNFGGLRSRLHDHRGDRSGRRRRHRLRRGRHPGR